MIVLFKSMMFIAIMAILKRVFLFDENGKKVIKSGLVVDILQFYEDWQ